MAEKEPKQPKQKKFGTFAGVFTPTTLTILGVILFIRHGWVVGNAGVLGATAIVLLSVTITLTTALSLSSITTNVRIGSGGAFSLISKSLGVEIGGAIGIPFYFAQAIAVAMYIFGFREGLTSIFPDANHLMLDVIIFATVFAIAFISTSFAFKIQYVILGVIVFSLIAIYGSLFTNELNYNFQLFGNYPGDSETGFKGTNFWVVFAVFFPAVTGVMAGANMSGDLENPRKAIPNGTLSSVILTTIIYLSLIVVASMIATEEELVGNYNVLIDKSVFPPIVLAGLLGATLSSALGSFVGAPRILLALGEKNILPKSKALAKTTLKGEPRNAMYVTTIVVLLGLLLRDLNAIAPLLTMFFMITYTMVNVVAYIEQSLGLPSYRPTLKIPLIVPLIGAFGSLTIMFVINPFVAMVSLILIVIFYLYLVKKRINSFGSDSRSGLFTALAEWATAKSTELSPEKEPRSWRPDLLIPTTAPKEIRGSFKLIQSIASPKGSVKILALNSEKSIWDQKLYNDFLPNVASKFKEIGIPMTYTFIDSNEFNQALNISMQAMNASFFKPNTIFIPIDSSQPIPSHLNSLLKDAKKNNYGVVYYVPFSTASLAIENSLSLWISNLPNNWKDSFDIGENNLAVLSTILIHNNWKGTIHANIQLLEDQNLFEDPAEIESFSEMIRFPKNTTINIFKGDFKEEIVKRNNTDLHIVSINENMTIKEMIEIVNAARISMMFCSDSTLENAVV